MDILQYLPNLLGGGLVATLLVQVGKKLLNGLNDRYGALATQFMLLLVSFLVAGLAMLVNLLPPQILQTTITIFASAMAIYEILWKGLVQQAVMGKTE